MLARMLLLFWTGEGAHTARAAKQSEPGTCAQSAYDGYSGESVQSESECTLNPSEGLVKAHVQRGLRSSPSLARALSPRPWNLFDTCIFDFSSAGFKCQDKVRAAARDCGINLFTYDDNPFIHNEDKIRVRTR